MVFIFIRGICRREFNVKVLVFLYVKLIIENMEEKLDVIFERKKKRRLILVRWCYG